MPSVLPYDENCIAVVGMACRFPDADHLEQYWNNLLAGRQAMRPVEKGDYVARYAAFTGHPGYVGMTSCLRDVELFDADFFGIAPGDAAVLDPQHRLLLETAWRALEDSGDTRADVGSFRTGVYAAANMSSYLLSNLHSRAAKGDIDYLELLLGNDKDYLATRIAYKLNFRGPAFSVQSACSSSLVAVHTACQALLQGECDRALVGAATITVPSGLGYIHIPGGMRSPDGRCRPYDRDAAGTIFGNGVGVVVLKRLGEALEAYDPVWAVIRASAINNDGASKVGFTAPNPDAQFRTIVEAMRLAGTRPEDVSFVEGHGTGTPLGDPVEISALLRAYVYLGQGGAAPGQPVILGSVKSNIGHLDCAAGMAGLIKTALSLHQGVVPGTANFASLNPLFGPDISPLAVRAAPSPLSRDPQRRIAGLSSFGFGGTNAHLVLQGAPFGSRLLARRHAGHNASPQFHVYSETACDTLEDGVLLLSARDVQALDGLEQSLRATLASVSLPGLARALACGRDHLPYRRAFHAHRDGEGVNLIALPGGKPVEAEFETVFLLPGQGAQYPGMFRDLYVSSPEFRNFFARHANNTAIAGGPDLLHILRDCHKNAPGNDSVLAQTEVAQPLLLALELALADLFRSIGLQPARLLGHSLGEYAAACIAGVFSPEDAAHIVVGRGRIMQKAPPGRMLAALLDREKLDDVLGDLAKAVEIVVINSETNCVLAAKDAGVLDACCDRLLKAGGYGVFLRTSHAYHSSAMDGVLDEFGTLLSGVALSPPRLPVVSNTTGLWAGPEIATPEYWVRHLRSPVRFDACLKTLFATPGAALELGPGNVLGALAARLPTAAVVSPFAQHAESTPNTPKTVLAELWLAGGSVDWKACHADLHSGGVPLPPYPLRPVRHWLDPLESAEELDPVAKTQTMESAAGTSHRRTVRPMGESSGSVIYGDSLDNGQSHASGIPKNPRRLKNACELPQTPIQRCLVSIWEELLHVAPIGINDSFIELGGNSVHVLRMIRMAMECGLTFSIRDVFEASDIAGLCTLIDSRSVPEADADATAATVSPGWVSTGGGAVSGNTATPGSVSAEDMDALLRILSND